MATYCIGDVQGCFTELQQLLQIVNYQPKHDQLWFVGDLVNRGPNSLEVLQFVQQQPNVQVVLGNHDLHLLTFYHGFVDFAIDHLEPILRAPDGERLIAWLRYQSLLHYDSKHKFVMVHAGLYPAWSLEEAESYAREVEAALQGEHYLDFLAHLYGDEPAIWSDNLRGWDRLRFIVNAFTRMRFCDLQGRLDFKHTGTIANGPVGFMPWFTIPWRKTKRHNIAFGHWAALQGKTTTPNIFALDTGCVWGNSLTALRLEDRALFSTPL